MKRISLLGALLALSFASVDAQLIYDITPSVGYRLGGGFNFTPDGSVTNQRLSFDDNLSYGIKLAVGPSPSFFLELEWDRQGTALHREGIVGGDEMSTLDVTIDYYDASLLFQYAYDRLQPYFLFGGGVGVFNPAGDFKTRTRFTMGAGAGAKYFLTHQFGLRGQVRFYTTSMNSNESGYWCDYYGCWSTIDINWLTQWSFTGGAFVRFGGGKRRRY